MDSEIPLLWDLAWLFLFGVLFLYLGWRVASTSIPAGGGRTTALTLVAAAVVAGPLAALPPQDVSTTIVLFKPGTSDVAILAALAEVDGRLVWSNQAGTLWAFDLPDEAQSTAFYRHGALLVSGGFLAAACLNWTSA